MKKILFIHACVRPHSRTLQLAKEVLQKLDGCVEELNLYETPLVALDEDGMKKREAAVKEQRFEDPTLRFARQFSQADSIVVAAPYWDLMFPAVLKTYLENVTVCGITFCYTADGKAQALCKADSLYYVTTAGGFIGEHDFGFSYIEALSKSFFGITDVYRFAAEGLDIDGVNVEQRLNEAKAVIEREIGSSQRKA